jgi:hypothetical protein
MLIAETNHVYDALNFSSGGTITDINNLRDNATSNTALFTPVGGSLTLFFRPASPRVLNAFAFHMHTATDPDATLTVQRYGTDNGFIDQVVMPLVPQYTGGSVITSPQDRHQCVGAFQGTLPRTLSQEIVKTFNFVIDGHDDPFEAGMVGAYDATHIKNGHVSGEINDTSSTANTQAKTSTTFAGGVSSTHKTVVRDYSFALQDFISEEKETFLGVAEVTNQTFPFFLMPIPNFFFDGKPYAHPGEEGGIVRLTTSPRFNIANAMQGSAEDVYHAQNIGLRRWI